jgi:ketosteroid isomerase-like protein
MAYMNVLLDTARAYLLAIEAGAIGDDLAKFFALDVLQHELPNRLVPTGASRDLAAILAAAERGQMVVASQRYVVRSAIQSGDSVAMEVEWSATLNVPVGSLPAGGEMRAHFAVFLDFRDGKIVSQRNYDCFQPF